MKVGRRAWTKKELNYLKENLGKIKLKTLAKHLGRSHASVRVAAHYYGLCKRLPKREEWVEEFRKAHKKGLSDPELAQKFGLGCFAIRKRREKLGLPINRHQRCKLKNKVRLLHAKGYSDPEMDFHLDLNYGHASSIRARLGLKPNPSSGRPKVKWSLLTWPSRFKKRRKTA